MITRLIFLILSFLVISFDSAFAVLDTEIPLSSCQTKYGDLANSCNQCFESELHDGNYRELYDTFTNNSSLYRVLYTGGSFLGFTPQYQTLQTQAQFVMYPSGSFALESQGPNGVFVFDSSVPSLISPTRGKYLYFAPGSQGVRFVGTKAGYGLGLKSVSAGIDGTKPALKITYDTNTYTMNGTPGSFTFATGIPETHRECLFVYPRYCGDGIISGGEKCDDGAQNGTPGKCNLSCNGTIDNLDPVCSSQFNGAILSTPIDASTVGLCTVGATTSFQAQGSNPIAYSWSCNSGTKSVSCSANGITYPSCNPAKTGTQSAPVNSTDTLCTAGTASGFTSTGSNPIGYAWSCNNAGQAVNCIANYSSSSTGTGFDLSLKKYINTLDAQPGSPVALSNGSVLNYVIRVKNEGPQTTTGLTTVRDILPVGVSASGAASGTNWNCSYSGAVLACMTSQVVSSGSYFSDITVPVVVTATAGQTVTNYATVQNPSENNPCYADNRMPNGDESSCTNDTKNNDPAQFSISGGGGGGGGGAAFVGKSCVNGIVSCAYYNSITACTAAGIPQAQCYSADAVGQQMCQNQSLSCSGPGGPSGPGNPSNWNSGRCGDGVLQAGEECDVVGAPWCSAACKLDMTNPGANPIVDFWMKIPTFSSTRMGYSWIDGETGKIPFSANSILVGQGTKVFTTADIVGFGIRTRFNLPLMLEADRRICLSSEGRALNGDSTTPTTLCTTFGEAAAMTPGLQTWTRPIDGKKYVVLGNGYFQYQNAVTAPYIQTEFIGNKNFLNLFRGANQYQTPAGNIGPTLMSAFQGNTIANDGYINLVTDIGVNLAKLPVRVSSAIVATTATPVNTSIDKFVNFSTSSLLEGFLANIAPKTTLSSVIIANPNSPKPLPTANITLPTVTGNRVYPNFEKLNGNPNILYVKGGNATINTPLSVNGVQTIIVEDGSLIIESDITYANADSSVAFIVKNGNIAVKDTVGNIAGVFVVIPGSTGNSGQFVPLNGLVSQKILRVEGSLYGDAKSLFNSRLYARGTNAYDILTTGTVLTYSNRALVNPPPLLSQFLGNYSVSRVVQ